MKQLLSCRLYIVPTMLLTAVMSFGRARTDGWCSQGNATVTMSGMTGSASTPKVQASYPGCTVSVYLTGTTTLATIYGDNSGAAKGNPFTAAANGYYFFYADDGRYDVALSGGGMSAPMTLGDRPILDPLFTAPNSNAVARPIASKLAERLSVKDFNAKGDGATDDTVAFQQTYAAAVARNGAAIYMPCGTYVLTSTAGNSALWIQNPRVSLIGDAEACVTLQYNGSGTAIRIQMNPFVSSPAATYANFLIRGTAAGQIGLQTGSIVSGHFSNIMVDGFVGAGAIGIDLQDRLDLNAGGGGSWTERNTFDNVSGGGYAANNTYGWVMEVIGGPVNNSFGYNRFINSHANAHANQTGLWIKSGSFFYNSSMIFTCNLDDAGTFSTAPVCIQSDGNAADNFYQVTGEYSGTHTASSVRVSSGGGFWGQGYVSVFDPNAALIPGQYLGTNNHQAPVARLTAIQNGQTWDTGGMAMDPASPATLSTPNIVASDRSGITNIGLIVGANIASPFVSMYSAGNNKFMVCSLDFGESVANCPAKSKLTVESGGIVRMPGASFVGTGAGTLRVGGIGGGGVSGFVNMGLYTASTTSGPGQINESIMLGGGNQAGIGEVDGVNIAHPISYAYSGDSIAHEWYAKPFQTALTAANRVAYMTIGGAMVASGFGTTGGATGLTITKTVKGSDGANCTLSYSSGLLTATTCP